MRNIYMLENSIVDRKHKIYTVNYTLNVEDMIEFFEDGKDVRVDLYQDETLDVLPINALGDEEKIYSLYYTAYDYFECGNFKAYMDFLDTCENVINIDGFEIHINYK